MFAIVLAGMANNPLTAPYMDMFRPKYQVVDVHLPDVTKRDADQTVELGDALSNPDWSSKGDLEMTRVFATSPVEQATAKPVLDGKADGAAVDQLASGIEGEVTSGPETPGSDTYVLGDDPAAQSTMTGQGIAAGQPASPILQKDFQTGRLTIGSFKAVALRGRPSECIDFGRSMLKDVGAPREGLAVVTSSNEITIAKICAENGSIVISCRGNQVTVSPRRLRPDDKCPTLTLPQSLIQF